MSKTTHFLSIDCPPGLNRPDYILHQLCSEVGLSTDMFTKISSFFGNWTWSINPIYDNEYTEKRPKIKEVLSNYYNNGIIRYAEW